MSVVTLLPLDQKGSVYRSVMPYSYYDPSDQVFPTYKEKEIGVVVLLSSDEECRDRSGRDLRKHYEKEGMKVIYLPTKDFGPLPFEILDGAVEAALTEIRSGTNLAIHCFAGCGRTGMFASCLTAKIKDVTGDLAIKWVRNHVPCAVEASEQEDAVMDYCIRKGYGSESHS